MRKLTVTRHTLGPSLRAALGGVLLAALIVTGCTSAPPARERLYRELVSWLVEHTLAGDTVAVSEADGDFFAPWPIVSLPATDDAFALLDVLQVEKPDYVVANDGLAWDGLRVQPWFRRHYHRVRLVSDGYLTGSPLALYLYRPAPFDTGQTITRTQSFGGKEVGIMELKSHQLSAPRVLPEVPLYVTLQWTTPTGLDEPLSLHIELVGVESGRLWARVERSAPGGVATDLWHKDVTMTDRAVLVPPSDLPAGSYALRLSLRRPNGKRLRVGGDETVFTLVTLENPPLVSDTAPDDISTLHASFGEQIELVGYTAPAWVAPGETVRIVLYWHARATVPKNYKVFVHLLTPENRILAQDDSEPAQWAYPTTQWEAGEYIRDEHILTLDPETPWGDWTLAVGMYDPATQTRLIIRENGEKQSEEFVVLQALRVR